MALVFVLLYLFCAYRVWQQETFFGVRRQWLKMVIFFALSPIAVVFLLIEALFSRNKRLRLTKGNVTKEIEREINRIVRAPPSFHFEGDIGVEARRYVESEWQSLTTLAASPEPNPTYAAAYVLVRRAAALRDQRHRNADILCLAVGNTLERAYRIRPNKSDVRLVAFVMTVCEYLTQPRTPAEEEIMKLHQVR